MNGCFGEINGNKYFTLFSTNESKKIMKKCEKLWSNIRDLARLIANNPDDYHQKYTKIKFNSDDNLLVNKN